MTTTVHHAEALRSLRGMRANTFHAMLSDPPYGLSFMGKAWDKVIPPAELWAETLRVLRPGAYALVFGGTRTFHRLAVALEDAGFEVRDCLLWLHGQGFPKSMNVGLAADRLEGVKSKVVGSRRVFGTARIKGGQGATAGRAAELYATKEVRDRITLRSPASALGRAWDGYGTALKPAWEPVLLVRKPLEGTVAANVKRWGCGALAIDASRIRTDGETIPVFASNKTSRFLAREGVKIRATGERRPAARFPANVLLDEDAARELDARVGDLGRTSKPGAVVRRKDHATASMAGTLATLGRPEVAYGDSGGPSRFFYASKVSTKERNAGVAGGCGHPTLKPLSLTTYLARLLLPADPAARILVPFSGAGSELIGARRAGWRHVVGIERDAQSVADAKARLAYHARRAA